MSKQTIENREQKIEKTRGTWMACSLVSAHCSRRATRGFTLIETLVAVVILITAIVSPLLLTERSLSSAYYARDQITAYYLGQEAIEQVRQVRDHNIMLSLQDTGTTDIFAGLPNTDGVTPFRVDATVTSGNPFSSCSIDSSTHRCTDPLQTDAQGTIYNYSAGQNTKFIRSVWACYVQSNGGCNSAVTDEVRVTATVSWTSNVGDPQPITISEDLYRWVQ